MVINLHDKILFTKNLKNLLIFENICIFLYPPFTIKYYDQYMRVDYKELMEKLGVGHELAPYETRPWFLHDSEQGISCSAEVRIGPGAEDVELEIQFLHDEEDARYDDDENYGGPEQIMMMRFLPSKEHIWAEKLMYVRGEDYANKIHDWGERGCEFFCNCIGALQMGEMPDIDEMIEQSLTDRSKGGRGGRKGRVGKKGFKVEQKPMMGMKN
ncbi:MAG: hypothetical protein COA45_09350 [Zetaproteobacteria bacterium]|nr:MAG: hypothetical protein COA45_09350 [Zetaproteobacteria bacterium]